MREAVFVRRHADDWKAFEEQLRGNATDPDALADGYVRLGDDLAYAKTFYPGSATAAYLNDLSAEVHSRLYTNRRAERGRFRAFWSRDIPMAVWESRWALAWGVGLFVLCIGLGFLSAVGDDGFVRLILGDEYIAMTLDNIERGDPFAVYKKMSQGDMTAVIGFNNVVVSFLAFVGIIQEIRLPAATLGCGWALVSNGVMVGAFAHLFAAEGLMGEWFRVVMIHGTIELAAIALAGGAGFAMWSGLFMPGTYPRLVSFRRSALRGVTIIIGLVPFFAVAALLESFVTRLTDMPLALSLVVILGSLAALVGYFVVLPLRVAREAAQATPTAARSADRAPFPTFDA